MKNSQIFVDFDGTITSADSTDLLLEQFADPSWRVIEEAWVAGAIGSRECIARQVGLLRISQQKLENFVSGVRTDPYFPEFVDFCRGHAIPVMIVSDGLDAVIRRVLAGLDLDVPFVANRMKHVADDRWMLEFPNAKGDCASLAGNCKCAAIRSGKAPRRILIGDGRSDFCAATSADIVFAKNKLVDFCLDRDIPHFVFQDFRSITGILKNLLEENARLGGEINRENIVV